MTTLTIDALVERIRQMHETLVAQAVRAVNIGLTVRNWAIGFYIEEYERGGVDRSQYGDRLMDEVAERLTTAGLSNCNRRQLYRYCDFYRAYPGIMGHCPHNCVHCSRSLRRTERLWGQCPHKVIGWLSDPWTTYRIVTLSCS